MTKNVDPDKQSDWQKRLARFRASGQTVTHFCQQEKVTPSNFYYWSKRLRQKSPAASTARSRRRRDSKPEHLDKSAVGARLQPTGDTAPAVPMVHFFWNRDLQISVPADCLDAIRSVLEWSRAAVAEIAKTPGRSSAFHEVLVDAR